MQSLCTRAAALAAAPLLLTACQSYEPRELAPDEHLARWRSRLPEAALVDSDSVREFARALGRTPEGVGDFDLSDGLDLDEGRLVALAYHPRIALERLRLERAAADVEVAGLFDDPEFEATLLRVIESAPDRWFIAPGLSFTIPLSDRLDAERDLAAAEAKAALADLKALRWEVWRDVRQSWIAWSAAHLAAAETERYLEGLDALARTASELGEIGELAPGEAALFSVERARQANELVRLRGEIGAGELALRGQLGLAPEAEVRLIPLASLPAPHSPSPAPQSLADHPELARRWAEYDAAEETLRLEIARQTPDLTLGPLFEADQGFSKLGLFGGLPLPIWNRNARAIARAQAERELARAAFETDHQDLLVRLAQSRLRAQALREQREGLENELVPLVDRQRNDAAELMRIGEGTGLLLLESLRRAHETKLSLIETSAEEAHVDGELEHLFGPTVVGAMRESSSNEGVNR